jgi:hypothetical protein
MISKSRIEHLFSGMPWIGATSELRQHFRFSALGNFHSLRRGSEQLGYGEWTARVSAQTKHRRLMKSGVICYLCSDPIRFLEGLLFVRKLYLSQNNARQLALVNIDSPYEPSMRDAVARLLNTPFPADSIEHRFGVASPQFTDDNVLRTVCIRCEPQALWDFSWRRCSRGGGKRELTSLVPSPREQFVDLLHRMVRQAGKDVGEPGLRINVI